jgi:hypothetical protein
MTSQTQANPSEHEHLLLAYVAEVREQAREVNPELADALGRARAELAEQFSGAALDARFDGVLRFYKEYVLPIENVIHPLPVTDGVLELKAQTLPLLQAYWRAMGREHHDPDSFPELAPGTRVRLRRGALQRWDVFNATTEHVGWNNSKGSWVVEQWWDREVDGVPVYWLEREDRDEAAWARQTAILPG